MVKNSLHPSPETFDRETLAEIQQQKLQGILSPVLRTNRFYGKKLGDAGVEHPLDVQTVEDYRKIPFTTKEELSLDQAANPPFGSNLSYPLDQYRFFHQTSGTKGEPLRWLDDDDSWRWFASCWEAVYRAAGVTSTDRIFFAFSFGPFIGFWAAYEGARQHGSWVFPGGGMSSFQRIKAIRENEISVLTSTPTYALRLAEVAREEGIPLADSKVRITIHAGEPGASVPSTRERIERAWGARCYDHAGATEVGPWGFECQSHSGLHFNEEEFICEVIDPATGKKTEDGELVITNLGRPGMPVIRYRTGDRVTLNTAPCDCGRTFWRSDRGVIGRLDDALTIRGVTVFPSTIEDIVRRFPEVVEYAVDVYRRNELDDMQIRLEIKNAASDSTSRAIEKEIRTVLGLRVHVEPVPYNTLPRFDLKAKRVADHRQLEVQNPKVS